MYHDEVAKILLKLLKKNGVINIVAKDKQSIILLETIIKRLKNFFR